MDDDWRPLSIRSGQRGSSEYDALHEGVPEWLKASLWEWVEAVVYELRERGVIFDGPASLSYEAERRIRARLGASYLGFFETTVTSQPEAFLDLVDFLIANLDLGKEGESDLLVDLHRLLSEAGSAWTPSRPPKHQGLQRRVPEEVEINALTAMEPNDRAAEYLRNAWRDVYSRSPDPSDGYKEAIRAVEAVAAPVVSAENSRSTLGTMIRDLEAKPSKWVLELHPLEENQVLRVAEMMRLLWRGQHDRHGSGDVDAPMDVSQEEAESAVQLAVLLVHWFRRGVIRRRT